MASEVDICNLALAHFGQDASIDAIDPPDGSAEAEHCARFYPIARDEILEAHPWPWATFIEALSEVTNDRADWTYRYALPNQCLNPLALLPDGFANAQDDGQPYEWSGGSVYTNESGASLRFVKRVTDTSKFTPMFVAALSWRLASYVSGPITKDPTGSTQTALYKRSELELARATSSVSNASQDRATHIPTAKRVR